MQVLSVTPEILPVDQDRRASPTSTGALPIALAAKGVDHDARSFPAFPW